MHPPLYGLILAGGKSSRMGKDKSQLEMRPSINQLDYLWQLITPLVEQCYVSRAHNSAEHPDYPSILDLALDQGPLGGISSALQSHPNSAFLVVACDLPLLTSSTLEKLIQERHQILLTSNLAKPIQVSCYLNPHDKRPEPLCSIYEPSAITTLQQQLKQGKYCARKMVESSHFLGLNLEHSYTLNNTNTPYDLSETQAFLKQKPMKKNIHIHYFAQLKTQTNTTQETYSTYAATVAGLYDELKMKYGFNFKPAQLKVAINDEFCSWDKALSKNDKIVFMPPVTGG